MAGGDELTVDCQRLGQQGVVAIEEDQVLSSGQRSAMVARGAGAAIDRKSGKGDGGAKGAQDFRCAVPRAIVDDDDFPAREILVQGRFNGLPDKPFVVVSRR